MNNDSMARKDTEDTTHFGFRDVPVEDKEKLVAEVFTSVASSYDVMNDLMSLGIHRLWKRHFVTTARVRAGHQVLDLAGGTGDIASLLYSSLGDTGSVVVADINAAMLDCGRDRLLDEGKLRRSHFIQANAEALPFADRKFDLVTMAFGLRNVTDKNAALRSIHRVLKPGGRILVLEFSQLRPKVLRPAYDWYSFNVLPALGTRFAGDADSYRYLAESIRKHPDQETLDDMLSKAGFVQQGHRNLSAGLVAIHQGVKP
ncbi:MAG: bifunctional demethylmenaquinone methyltransferase/2-methoxy-6-polyprenyl-1,4-benzoquinol methylase UbiE [Lysobacterales bacterium]